MNKLNSIVISLFRKWRGYARTEATEFELIVASVFMSGFVIQSGALMYHLQVGADIIGYVLGPKLQKRKPVGHWSSIW